MASQECLYHLTRDTGVTQFHLWDRGTASGEGCHILGIEIPAVFIEL